MTKSHARAVLRFIRSHRRSLGWAAACLAVLLVVGSMVLPRSHTFSYGGNNCFRDITWFPGAYSVGSGSGYGLEYREQKSLAGHSLLSTRTCVQAKTAPKGSSRSRVGLSLVGIPMAGKQFSVVTPELPQLRVQGHTGKISIREEVAVSLDREDTVFNYVIRGNNQQGTCRSRAKQLLCPVTSLKLAQDTKYPLSIERRFEDKKVGTVLQKSFLTTDPVIITGSSIANDATVYDTPQEITLDTSKELASAKVRLKKVIAHGATEDVATTSTVKGKQLLLKIEKPLDRRVTFRLVVDDLVAQDKGVLLKPQTYSFTTSGGPKVTGANIGTRSVQPGVAIVLVFDQALQPAQEIAAKISVAVNGVATTVDASISGNRLFIQPKASWGLCTPFTIKLTAEVSSMFNISGDSGWQINSRTICYSVSTIGYSVQGRPIHAWRFGSGATKLLFVGATHGDEQSTKYLMEEWIRELDANPSRIPSDKTIIVIPVVNPDGFAATRRQNASNVDLNRNFPTYDWKSDVTMPPGGAAPVVNGGGASPLSEPESQALSNIIYTERPSVVLTFHSVASIVSGNGTGNADALAQLYAQTSGYRYLPKSDTNIVFQYDTTGAFEDWLHDKVGTPAILVELGSSYRSEFSKNKNALWAMISN